MAKTAKASKATKVAGWDWEDVFKPEFSWDFEIVFRWTQDHLNQFKFLLKMRTELSV